MSPGEELDALVAKKVLGLKVVTQVSRLGHKIYSIGQPDYDDYAGEMVLANPLLPYSTSIEAAWEVISTIPNVRIETNGLKWFVCSRDTHSETILAIADTAPHAVCLAALKAVGYES